MTTPKTRNENEPEYEKSKIKGDWCNIFLLTFMYTLQCIPRGLAEAIPLILQKRKITYIDQAGFSLSQYPYSFKLFWSPIVDSVYSNRMGRRKTWVIPMQFLMGLTLLLLAVNIDEWLGSEDGSRKPKTRTLAILFFLCSVAGSTQDIALDGWALTMLKKRNVGYQAACNNIGYILGNFSGYVLFLALDSKDLANLFYRVPQDHGLLGFSDFVFYWSILYLVATVLICMLKRDNSLDVLNAEGNEYKLGLKRSYKLLWQILKLKPIQKISLIMLTHQVAFAPNMVVSRLKLVDAGMSANTLSLLSAFALPFIVLSPFLFGEFLTGYRSMHSFLRLYTVKLILNLAMAAGMFIIPYIKGPNADNPLPAWYYWITLIVYNAESFMDGLMWMSCGSFFPRISDSRFGGMYMTFFNVLMILGIRTLSSLSLWLVEPLTIRRCDKVNAQNAKTCEMAFDGYFTEVITCMILGIVWFFWARRQIDQLQKLSLSAWIVEPKPRVTKEQEFLYNASSAIPL